MSSRLQNWLLLYKMGYEKVRLLIRFRLAFFSFRSCLPAPSSSSQAMDSEASSIENETLVDLISTTEMAISSEIEECYNDPAFTIFTYTVDDMLLAASMAATVFNVMVIFCAIKLFKRSGDTMHLFILNMTIGDLVLTIFCHPNELLIRKHEFLQQKHLCAVVHYFNWIGLAVSGLSLTLLNVDKMSSGKKFYYEIFTMLFCVLPVTSSLIVSMYLFNLTRKKRNARNNGGDTNAFKNKYVKMKSLAFIFATTAWTSCSLLPYRIVNLARIHLFTWSELSCEGKQMMNWIAWVLVYLLTLNPIVNPLITSLIYAPYRLTIKKFLVNIPVGNRPLYTYQAADNVPSDNSFVSVRRNRNRRSSVTELASLRQSTEVVRMSVGDPCTPSKPNEGNFQFQAANSDPKTPS
ncbi:unnamed protein product [Caenorhabditis auriculariae]|uniref:G-protein coupled receptors family 1 profile domain-containing protein n=1 Tax=Caenorhabditis auriculariae TaxID=2777116 RepID=A0A8S1H322_9PELO|nr:unnamed protein product [Caenorhabditis auriculariae]